MSGVFPLGVVIDYFEDVKLCHLTPNFTMN